MALNLYRRHRKECEGGHPEDTRSGEFEEGRRGWKKCACLIHVSGTLGGKFNRKQTGKSNWDEAKTIVGAWEKAGAWDSKLVVQLPSKPPAAEQPKRTTVADAVNVFLLIGHDYVAAIGDSLLISLCPKYSWRNLWRAHECRSEGASRQVELRDSRRIGRGRKTLRVKHPLRYRGRTLSSQASRPDGQ